MNDDDLTVIALERKPDFVETAYVRGLAERATFYLKAGYPVHFSGTAGTGKTTLAMHVAAELGRPVILIHGDDKFGSSDLIGGQMGYCATRVIDNFIHSVVDRRRARTAAGALLELSVLANEKQRLQDELANACRRRAEIERRLDEIAEKEGRLQAFIRNPVLAERPETPAAPERRVKVKQVRY